MKLDVEDLSKLKYFSNKKKFRNRHKLLPQFPFNMIISGQTGAGKTMLLLNLIVKWIVFDKLYLYTKHMDQPAVQMLITFFEKIQAKTGEELLFVSSDIEDVVPVDELDGSIQNLVVFDDFILESNLDTVVDYYVRGRHRNCSNIFLTQIYTKIPRPIRLNTKIFCFFFFPAKELQILNSEINFCLTKEKFKELFVKAINEKYNFFYVDTTQKKKALMFRKNFNQILIDKEMVDG